MYSYVPAIARRSSHLDWTRIKSQQKNITLCCSSLCLVLYLSLLSMLSLCALLYAPLYALLYALLSILLYTSPHHTITAPDSRASQHTALTQTVAVPGPNPLRTRKLQCHLCLGNLPPHVTHHRCPPWHSAPRRSRLAGSTAQQPRSPSRAQPVGSTNRSLQPTDCKASSQRLLASQSQIFALHACTYSSNRCRSAMRRSNSAQSARTARMATWHAWHAGGTDGQSVAGLDQCCTSHSFLQCSATSHRFCISVQAHRQRYRTVRTPAGGCRDGPKI